MREIKFRAWDKVNKIMQYSGIIWGDYDFPALSELNYGDNIYNLSNLMQYTGLKDKNGKEIYDGDIIEAYEFIQKPKMVVKFDEEMAGFIPFIWKQALEYQDYIGYFAHEDWCIVIGNIYENPELLDRVEEVEEIPIMKGTREALDKIVI